MYYFNDWWGAMVKGGDNGVQVETSLYNESMIKDPAPERSPNENSATVQ
jgi:hypothetical protein